MIFHVYIMLYLATGDPKRKDSLLAQQHLPQASECFWPSLEDPTLRNPVQQRHAQQDAAWLFTKKTLKNPQTCRCAPPRRQLQQRHIAQRIPLRVQAQGSAVPQGAQCSLTPRFEALGAKRVAKELFGIRREQHRHVAWQLVPLSARQGACELVAFHGTRSPLGAAQQAAKRIG